MHAGLAVLSNDLEFVSDVLRTFRCGMTYDARDPATLTDVITRIVTNPERLQAMKENAYAGMRDQFNWERQSVPYRQAIVELAQMRN
jgi:glycosyltransferase involved in cell wall biosynthesis